eukprot:jgi/Galph1/1243/GphlegSOOS_G6034.1
MYREKVSYQTEEKSPFLLQNRKYSQQYAQIYFCRLNMLRPVVDSSARGKWNEKVKFVNRLLNLVEGEICVICGVVYKEMDLKPSILKEYTKNPAEPVPILPVKPSFVSDSDQVFLEDETGRIRLNFSRCGFDEKHLVTGVVIAVNGQETSGGEFIVEDICLPELAPSPTLNNLENDVFVLFVSGIGLGDRNGVSMMEALLLDFITGKIGNEIDKRFSCQIAHVFILGNLISFPGYSAYGAKYLDQPFNSVQQLANADSLIAADRFITTIASTVPLTLLPGEADPSNVFLPQQPWHRCLLPSASRYSSVHRVTNPYKCCIEGRSILCTSGQNVEDVCRYSNFDFNKAEDRLTVMENMLHYRNICPTAPDTLPSYPYYEEDPFVINESPHVYVCGNQPSYGSRLVTDNNNNPIHVLSIPEFSSTGQVVLLNIRTLAAQVMETVIDLKS